jgi:hypothetical protein
MGQTADLMDLQRILLRQRPPLSNAAQQNATRWAVWAAAMIIRRYKSEYEALKVGCFLGGWAFGWGGWVGLNGAVWAGSGCGRGGGHVLLLTASPVDSRLPSNRTRPSQAALAEGKSVVECVKAIEGAAPSAA